VVRLVKGPARNRAQQLKEAEGEKKSMQDMVSSRSIGRVVFFFSLWYAFLFSMNQ
jgi:hypothetical protein